MPSYCPPPCARRALPLHPAAAAHGRPAAGGSGRGPQLPQQCPQPAQLGLLRVHWHDPGGGSQGRLAGRGWQRTRHHLQCGQTPDRRPRGGAQIQQAAERLERNFVDSRQLKVCATCFDLSVSLLRVLEMTITLVPEIFLDWARPTSEMLLRRLAQVCPSGQGVGTLGTP